MKITHKHSEVLPHAAQLSSMMLPPCKSKAHKRPKEAGAA